MVHFMRYLPMWLQVCLLCRTTGKHALFSGGVNVFSELCFHYYKSISCIRWMFLNWEWCSSWSLLKNAKWKLQLVLTVPYYLFQLNCWRNNPFFPLLSAWPTSCGLKNYKSNMLIIFHTVAFPIQARVRLENLGSKLSTFLSGQKTLFWQEHLQNN